MMTRALVIRMMGDPALTGPMADGVCQRVIPLDTGEMNALRAERDRLAAQRTIRNFGDDKRWRRTKRRLARKYRVKRHGKAYWAMMRVYALLCYGVDMAHKRLSAWNRR